MKAIKNIRLKEYDYKSDGYYFVTILTNYRQNLLCDATMNVVARFIGRLGDIPRVSVDYHIVMPNHIHMILILNNCSLKLGEIVRRFKARTSHALEIQLWQPNYYEHVIRNEQALRRIREYVQNNPGKENIEFNMFYPERATATATATATKTTAPDKSGNYKNNNDSRFSTELEE